MSDPVIGIRMVPQKILHSESVGTWLTQIHLENGR